MQPYLISWMTRWLFAKWRLLTWQVWRWMTYPRRQRDNGLHPTVGVIRLLILVRRPARYWCKPRYLQQTKTLLLLRISLERTLTIHWWAMLVPTSSKVVLAGILSQGRGGVPLYMESQLLAVTQSLTLVGMTSDLCFWLWWRLRGRCPEHDRFYNWCLCQWCNPIPQALVPTSCTTLVQVSSALTMALA